jgi:hypothetical protein
MEREGIVYANDGDWVESLTAIGEDAQGTLSLLHWNRGIEVLTRLPARPRPEPVVLPRAA